jgi:hypothetical protein
MNFNVRKNFKIEHSLFNIHYSQIFFRLVKDSRCRGVKGLTAADGMVFNLGPCAKS